MKQNFEEAAEKYAAECYPHNVAFQTTVKGFFLAGIEHATKWIDCKERLPDTKDDVLCLMYSQYASKKPIQFVGCYTKGHEIEYCDDDYQGEYDEIEDKHGTLYLKPGWYECEETPGSSYDEQWIKREVVAWQELPSPPSTPTV
jgi:hypothetical protein